MLKVYTDSEYYEGDTITTPSMDVGLELMVGFYIVIFGLVVGCAWAL